MGLNSFSAFPRLSFARMPDMFAPPNLIELQKNSYAEFLQKDVAPEKRHSVGLQRAFESVFPIKDLLGQAQIEFCQYALEEPKYTPQEARQKRATYASPLRCLFRLIVWDIDEDTSARTVRHIQEQEVYMGDMPLMTENGTFVINGIERVVVSQMHRSPGILFEHDRGRSHASGKLLYCAHIRPARGSWLDFEFDAKDLVYSRIDRKRKILASTFLMALPRVDSPSFENFLDIDEEGMSREDMLCAFYTTVAIRCAKGGALSCEFNPSQWRGKKLKHDLVDASTGKVIKKTGQKITASVLKELEAAKIKRVNVSPREVIGRYIASDFLNETTGEIYCEAGDELTEELLKTLLDAGFEEIPLLDIDHLNKGAYLRDTLAADKNNSRQEALIDIYRVLKPGDPPTIEAATQLFYSLFFDPEKYDLSTVGRVKMNARLHHKISPESCALEKKDILAIVRILLDLRDGTDIVDDIDSLVNRRIRSVGEMLEGQYAAGLGRLERSVKERIGSVDLATATPQAILNAKPLAATLRDFFGSSQLSQFMDQTNPLTEVTHKRRLSALGPGGLTRDRAGLEVRDVHPTHYGRICPVETPEGPSIGLINSLSTYARVNPYGFIESPYFRVKDGIVTNEAVYMSAIEEGRHTIAQGNAHRDDKGTLLEEVVSCRKGGDYILASPQEVDFIDVSPKQILSAAAALIPFVENDDPGRALMGANMQRQAVPLLKPEAPLVGTGMEALVAQDSGVVVLAKRSGIVDQVDGQRIVIRVMDSESVEEGPTDSGVDIYSLMKFQKTNANTCLNQKPLVRVGDHVQKGQVIADGPATDHGELALGRNVTVAFMPWRGYGFEDSIIISERLVQDDTFTSIHIEEFEVSARDTKLGSEQISRDIPGASEEALSRLDESGIVYVGAEVKPGDVLVGKVTPKGDNPMTPEEKLLRAIFGEKALDMRDTSLRLPQGVSGTIVDVAVFSRRGIEKDERFLANERAEVMRLVQERDLEKQILEKSFAANLRDTLAKQTITADEKSASLKKGSTLTPQILEELSLPQLLKLKVADDKSERQLEKARKHLDVAIADLQKRFDRSVDRLRRGDDLPSGVLKTVRVYVAVKRKLQPGDKMAGRHGNKGVVSKVVPVEDMPYLEDGTPVDMILNPLGLPSRMNLGQILETHLGWASKNLGREVRNFFFKIAADTKPNVKACRELLKKTYTCSAQRKNAYKTIDETSDIDIIRWLDRLTQGVPMKTPAFDGARMQDISSALKEAQCETSGQVTLYDGRTGEPFDRKVTVGVMYMLKLHHLVDEKIHARSVGPYSLITQQPLGGKAQLGGQRLGEMEVWALEAYGAAYTLREMLTIKSDDTIGRTSAYEAIIRGDGRFKCDVPESFNVLVKELRSLGLNMECLTNEHAGEVVADEDIQPQAELDQQQKDRDVKPNNQEKEASDEEGVVV
jgi:DNA-directed RNA polymerase subunit beta